MPHPAVEMCQSETLFSPQIWTRFTFFLQGGNYPSLFFRQKNNRIEDMNIYDMVHTSCAYTRPYAQCQLEAGGVPELKF